MDTGQQAYLCLLWFRWAHPEGLSKESCCLSLHESTDRSTRASARTRASAPKQTTTAAGKLLRPHTPSKTPSKEKKLDKTTEETAHVLKISENSPYIQITIGTHQFRTLLDTGSQLSLVSEDFIKLLDPQLVKPAKSANVTLISATGHKLATSKTVKIRITLGKNRMYHQFTVVPGFKHDMILGIDFLNERKAILDFENQVLIMGKSIHPLKPKPGQEKKEINLVRVAEDVDIFPRSDLQLKCFISKKKQPGEIFIVSQLPSSPCFEDEPGVLLPNAVVKVSKNRHIPWAVVNETGRFLHIKKGQVIGTAVGCKEEDFAPNVSPVQKDSDEHSDDSPSSKITEFNLDHVPSEQRDVLKDALLHAQKH